MAKMTDKKPAKAKAKPKKHAAKAKPAHGVGKSTTAAVATVVRQPGVERRGKLRTRESRFAPQRLSQGVKSFAWFLIMHERPPPVLPAARAALPAPVRLQAAGASGGRETSSS